IIRRPPTSTLSSSSAASDVYKRQVGRLRLLYLVGDLFLAHPQQLGHALYDHVLLVAHLGGYDGYRERLAVLHQDLAVAVEDAAARGLQGYLADAVALGLLAV